MRLMTYNIRLGKQLGLEPIAEIIRAHDPDLLAVQEIGDRRSEGPPGDGVARLARACELPHHHHARTIPTPGGPGAYGHALLSRWPLRDLTKTPLPRDVDEPRALLTALVDAPAGPLLSVSTHLSWIEDRPTQGAELLEHITSLCERHPTRPLVLMGDLNEPGPTSWLAGLAQLLEDADARRDRPTYPASGPTARIDYIWARGGALEDVRVPHEPDASDHLPVLATLRL